MSVITAPYVAPRQNLSTLGGQSAPTLVTALVGFLYLDVLVSLWQAVTAIVGLSDDSRDIMANARVVFLGLALALIPFLLAKGIARGAHGTWLLTLVLAVVAFSFELRSVLAAVTLSSILSVAVMVAVLTLLLTPVVLRHCTKR